MAWWRNARYNHMRPVTRLGLAKKPTPSPWQPNQPSSLSTPDKSDLKAQENPSLPRPSLPPSLIYSLLSHPLSSLQSPWNFFFFISPFFVAPSLPYMSGYSLSVTSFPAWLFLLLSYSLSSFFLCLSPCLLYSPHHAFLLPPLSSIPFIGLKRHTPILCKNISLRGPWWDMRTGMLLTLTICPRDTGTRTQRQEKENRAGLKETAKTALMITASQFAFLLQG